MALVRLDESDHESEKAFAAASPVEEHTQQPLAWEQIEAGRFMPRRICGSFRGGVLG
jgi:hypothetical protein